VAIFAACHSFVRADIPWPEVVQRLAHENEKLARRPQGHNGEYFVVCTLYYTPKESGFTFERGFDATPVTKPGLRGRKYPSDFLRSVKKEGVGWVTTPVDGRHYIRYDGGGSYAFASHPTGGGGVLVPRYSAALKLGEGRLRRGATIETSSPEVQKVFGSTRWRSWIPVADCAAGTSSAILAKSNRSDPASSRGDRVPRLSNTLTQTFGS
jgi:hypothetical protein